MLCKTVYYVIFVAQAGVLHNIISRNYNKFLNFLNTKVILKNNSLKEPLLPKMLYGTCMQFHSVNLISHQLNFSTIVKLLHILKQ